MAPLCSAHKLTSARKTWGISMEIGIWFDPQNMATWSANTLVSPSKMGIRSKAMKIGMELQKIWIWSLKPEIWTDNRDENCVDFSIHVPWMDGSRFCIPFFGVSNHSSHHPILRSNGQVLFASTIIPSNVSFPQQLAEITSSTTLGTRDDQSQRKLGL